MSTWAALFENTGQVEPRLAAMREELRDTPADGEWQWVDRRVGLVCRPLLVHEPHCDPATPARDHDVVIAFDGRLDNRSSLTKKLHLPDSASDPALVLACYRHFGESCAGQLEGDFAFAVADGERDLLLIARDAVGVRPLYYTITPHGFFCASRVSPLLGVSSPRPDLDAVARLLCRPQAVDASETFLHGVHALPPATALLVNQSGHRSWKYWEAEGSAHYGMTSADCLDAFRSLFQQSVSRRLRGVARAAVQVSGGLDSSSILCVAQESNAEVTGLYHGGVSGGPDDETPYLAALEHEGLTIERVPLLPSGYPELTDEAVRQSELPLVDDFPAAAQRVSLRARERGVRLLLNGTWADQLLFPFPPGYLVDAFHRLQWLTVARHLLAYPAWFTDVPRTLIWSTALRAVVRAHLPGWILQRRAQRRKLDAIARLLDPGMRTAAFAAAAPIERWSALASEHAKAVEKNVRSRRDTMALEWFVKSAGAYGQDIAFPFLDRDLVTLLLSAPPLAQMPDGTPKALLRKSMQQIVPSAILQRRDKGEYSAVVNDVMRANAACVFGELRDGHAIRFGILDESLFSGDLAKLRSRMNIAEPELAAVLGKLYGVECWLRRFGGTRHEQTRKA